MVARNPYKTLINVFRDNWNELNTDGKAPEFIRYSEVKTIDFRKNPDWLVITRFQPLIDPAGTGMLGYHDYQVGKIDIRCHNPRNTREQHFLEVVKEVQRILEMKFNLIPDGLDYDLIEPDGQKVDQGDEYKGVSRMVVPVKLIKYAVQRES